MITVTITNQKGGVGKTTTAHTLGAGLAQKKFRVLIVDADPQTNLTFTAGIDPLSTGTTLYDLMRKKATPAQTVKEAKGGFCIIPGSLDLAGADMEFSQAGREYLLKEALEPLHGSFDFCIIDTPPTLGILTVNALTASQKVIVPMCADIYSIQGLSQLQGIISNVKKYCNHSLRVEGLLITKYNPRTIVNRQLKESIGEVAERLETKVFQTAIREAVAIREAQLLQSDIFTEQPASNVAKDYADFINEFLKGDAQQ